MPIFSIPGAIIGGSIISGLVGANASSNAASAQEQASNNSTQLQQNIYNQNQQNLSPYMSAGGTSLNSLLALEGIGSPNAVPASGGPGSNSGNVVMSPMGGGFRPTVSGGGSPNASSNPLSYGGLNTPFNANTFESMSPAFQFDQQQGLQAVDNAVSSGQGALSGSAIKSLDQYAQNNALNSFDTAFQENQTQNTNIFNRLYQLSGLGENAAAGFGNTSTGLGANIANSITGGANANAAGQIGTANAISGSLNSLGGYYTLQSLLGGNNSSANSNAALQAQGIGLAGGG